jgi:hypothetical protein
MGTFRTRIGLGLCFACVLLCNVCPAEDWPQYKYDGRHSGNVPDVDYLMLQYLVDYREFASPGLPQVAPPVVPELLDFQGNAKRGVVQ